MAKSTDIKIDPSVLDERNETYSSLTDVNGAEVFTDTYEKKVKEYEQKEKQAYQAVQKDVFVQEIYPESDVYTNIKASMFRDTTIQMEKESTSHSQSQSGLEIPITIVISLTAILFILRYMKRRKEKRKQKNVDTYI